MQTTTDISNIKTMISSGRLDDAIMQLLQIAKSEKNTHLERFGIHFSDQLSDLSKDVINGTLSSDEMYRTKNKIQKSLLDVLGHYENNTLDSLARSGGHGPWHYA